MNKGISLLGHQGRQSISGGEILIAGCSALNKDICLTNETNDELVVVALNMGNVLWPSGETINGA